MDCAAKDDFVFGILETRLAVEYWQVKFSLVRLRSPNPTSLES